MGLVAAVPPDIRLPELLRRGREWGSLAVHKEHRLEVIWNAVVHDRAVPVALDVGFETLARVTPAHLADFAAGHRPLTVSLHLPVYLLRIGRRDHVHKSVAQSCFPREVGGKIHEVVFAREAGRVQELQQHDARVIIWKVAQHNCCHVALFDRAAIAPIDAITPVDAAVAPIAAPVAPVTAGLLYFALAALQALRGQTRLLHQLRCV
mmetsp:Transcript_15376/g.35981  ORF Transcript_15376/g.35981 Transcript_15376/m.35981 type:complete len:207 (-) Transcript_15376:335-955(-)